MSAFALNPLTPEEITRLSATSRTRGQYKDMLVTWLKDEENPGFCASDEPALSAKKANAIYAGFSNILRDSAELRDQARVINAEGKVYVVRKAV